MRFTPRPRSEDVTRTRLQLLVRDLEKQLNEMISLVPPNADELRAEAENCRQQAREADALTMRILHELADQYEAQARLLSAYPEPHRSSSGYTHL